MSAIEMTQHAVAVFGENRDRRILIPFLVFAAKIVFERAIAGTQETQIVPTSAARVLTQHSRIGRRDDREVRRLRQVMRHTVVAVDPSGAHRASSGLLLAKHEVVNNQRTIRRREQFTQTNLGNRLIAFGKRRRPFGSSPTVRKGVSHRGSSPTVMEGAL